MSDDWDFEVGRRPVLFDSDPREIGEPSIRIVKSHDVLYRKDTGAPLSVVSRRYALVTHKSVVEACRAYFGSLTMSVPVREEIRITKGGARLMARWDFCELDIGKIQEKMAAGHRTNTQSDINVVGLRVVNSLDESRRLVVEYGLYRLICSNWATIPIEGAQQQYSKRHVGELSVANIGEYLKAGVASVNGLSELLGTAASSIISVDQAKELIKTLGMPETYTEIAISNVLHDARGIGNFASAVTRWELFNAITAVISQRARDGKIKLDRQRDLELKAYSGVMAPLVAAE